MRRATIAGLTVELCGCAQWLHADKLARFPAQEEQASMRITVEETEALTPPEGDTLGQAGAAVWKRGADGMTVLARRDQRVQVRFDADFSDVTIRLERGGAHADVHRYRYVMQAIGYRLLTQGGALLHSAGLSIRGIGVALSGRSGVGKSTLATLLCEADPTVAVLCEDAPAVCTTADGIELCGTPFCGDDERCENAHVPLRALVFLKQGNGNRLSPMAPRDALQALLENIVRPYYQDAVSAQAVDLALAWIGRIPMFEFENDGTPSAAEALLAALAENGVTEKGVKGDL
ncbi:MAG: hypothetical protein IJB27_04550 [Clostridia bacterium]|nr:hypothetical protein [Clostridia bacterium]